MQDPLGNATNLSYSPLDDVTQVIDASGATTTFSYDHMRNLLSVTDANGGTTAYGYDSMARRISRTDPLSHADSYQYDGNSNLTQFTDRRGKITVYQYDGLNRRIFAGFGQNGSSYESSVNYTWDGGDRMAQAADSIAGTITRSYDGLDDLLAETTPQGSLSWSYDSARRRSSMQVAGQPAFTGRENDGTGIDYYRARYYSPTFQRFTGQDPIGFAGGGPNLYSYVLNNPINFADLLGLVTPTPTPTPTPSPTPTPATQLGWASLTNCGKNFLCICAYGVACTVVCAPTAESPPLAITCALGCTAVGAMACQKPYPCPRSK